MNKFKYQFLQY